MAEVQKLSKEMELNDYQEKAMTTCMSSSDNFAYMFINLVGEVGEFASKVAKAIRKEQVRVDNQRIVSQFGSLAKSLEFQEELKKEAGDIAWQLAGLCSVMGWSLEEVCQLNLDKLASRKQRNVIDGSGDNR
jgi:NTP pyrophosphatase (non-canonical NTP hydrolase)